ncbi:uncharacterized protein LOC142112087 [Mixophyes fleayi]|uniref:uncharacterized protein LOC142112087 n=1 Tax=Mixophyes fleayi TaxID=3061075 RepID=UPI003F4E4221
MLVVIIGVNMKVWIAIVFFTYYQCITAEGKTQNVSLIEFAQIGETATITCNISVTAASNLQWYKENKDGGLENVHHSVCPAQKSSKKIKYKDRCEKKGIAALEIENVEKSDSGVYYCSVSGLDQVFYVASTLVVTERDPVDPTLSILAPVEEKNAESGTTLLCVAHNWSNKWSQIWWSINGNTSEDWTTLDSEGSLISLIVIPTESGSQDPKVKCYIQLASTHQSAATNFIIASKLAISNDIDNEDYTECYSVMYVAIAVSIALLLAHQIILACRRRALSKGATRTDTGPSVRPDAHCERTVRFSPETETVTYAALKP